MSTLPFFPIFPFLGRNLSSGADWLGTPQALETTEFLVLTTPLIMENYVFY
jgi:hypothetical protein